MTPFLRTLALLLLAQGAAPAPPNGLSWGLAESFRSKLESLEKRPRPAKPAPTGETISLSDAELNSYLNLSLGPKRMAGASEVEVHLDQTIVARGIVDLDEVKGQLRDEGPFNPLALLGGRLPLEARGWLQNDGGFGQIHLQEVRLGPVSLPVSVLAELVASATRTPQNPEGFDIQSPFRLPYSVRRIRFQPGRALLDL